MTAHASTQNIEAHRGLHHLLWGMQVLLAIIFGVAGFMKLATPMSELGQRMAWVNTAPEVLVRFIGVSEIAGAFGLVAPGFTGIRPWLTWLAAGCLCLVMILAIGFHIARGEYGFLPPPILLGALSAVVAWGRLKAVPLVERAYW